MLEDTTAGHPTIATHPRSAAQQARIEATGLDRSVDVHCHCLPAIDDGPVDRAGSILLCQALVDDGITSVIATPHQMGRYDLQNSAPQIRQRVSDLNEWLDEAQVPLEVVPGGDVRIDERLPALIAAGEVCTAGGLGRHLLLELPNNLYCEPRPLITQLSDEGVQCIMTHPERHRYLEGRLETAISWICAGAIVQITAGSLVGDFGRYAFDYAWRLLNAGLVSIVASDAHDHIRRPPRMSAALAAIEQHHGSEAAATICVANPLRVWSGEHITPPSI